MRHRLHALDWMRGIAMVLMVTDHASTAFNAQRLITDSTFFWVPGTPLPALDFVYRWVSHLCAPSFVFLAGTSLALSVQRRLASGVGEARIDRDLFVRGLVIVIVDLTIISWIWFPGSVLLQVMYAIGGSMILMIPSRRFSTGALMVLALFVLVGSETLLSPGLTVPTDFGSVSQAMLFGSGIVSLSGNIPTADINAAPSGLLVVGYPLMPWWSVMALGWCFGRWILGRRERGEGIAALVKPVFWTGMLGLVVFAVLRGLNGYGNMGLYREGSGVLQWLHVSKYPPSITFLGLELGLMAVIMAACLALQERLDGRVRLNGPILVFGQTAFFFYLAHILILEFSARLLGVHHSLGLGEAVLAALAVMVILYPLCLWYRGFKTARPDTWLRYF